MANSHVNHMAEAGANHTPLNAHMVDSSTNQMADSSLSHTPLSHHMAYPSTSQMPYANTNQMPYPNQMAATNTYYRPLNYQVANHSTYCRPSNYQLAAPTFHYGALNHQLAGSRAFYGPLNHQLAAGSNSYYGQLSQLAGPSTYYRPLNHQMTGQSTFYGPLNHQYVRAPFDQNSQSRAHIQNQNLSSQLPLSDIPTAAALTEPSASPQLNGNSSVCMPPKCVGLVSNEEMVHKLEGSPAVAAAPAQSTTSATSQSNSATQRSKAEEQLHSERPYIKKPSNAFMLFMREHRPKVVAECKITNNASVNVILGQRWKSMSWEDKAPYYKQACEETQLHFQQHPDWSHMNNYGKKRKRVRGKAATRAKASARHHEEESPQMDQRSLASAQAGATQAPLCPTHAELMQAVCQDAAATTAPSARESSDSDCESTGSLAPIEDILDVVNVKLLSGPALTPDAGTELRSVCQGDAIGPTSLLRSPRRAAHSAIDSSSSDSDSGGSLAPIEDILGMLDVNLRVSQSPPEHSQPAITESQSQCDLADLHMSTALSPSPCRRPLMENHQTLADDHFGTFQGKLCLQNRNWKSRKPQEQALYYRQACEEKQLHFQQHPDWSHINNYGKKRKRVRGKAATRAKASAPHHEAEPPQMDQRSLASAEAGASEAPLCSPHTELMQAVCPEGSVAAATAAPSARESSDSDCESTGSLALIEDILGAPDVKLPMALTPPEETQQAMRESQTVCAVNELSPTSLLGPQQMTESCHVLSVDQLQQLLDYFESQQ